MKEGNSLGFHKQERQQFKTSSSSSFLFSSSFSTMEVGQFVEMRAQTHKCLAGRNCSGQLLVQGVKLCLLEEDTNCLVLRGFVSSQSVLRCQNSFLIHVIQMFSNTFYFVLEVKGRCNVPQNILYQLLTQCTKKTCFSIEPCSLSIQDKWSKVLNIQLYRAKPIITQYMCAIWLSAVCQLLAAVHISYSQAPLN